MSTNPSGVVRAVLFDVSGTTLDFGSRGPVVAFVELFARHGISVSEEEARRPMGTHKKDHIRAMLSDPAIRRRWTETHGATPAPEDVDRLYAEFTPLLIEVLPRHADVIPGVPMVVADLRECGMRIANTTGFESGMMTDLIRLAGDQGYVPDLWVCPDMVGGGRPAPWMAFHAARTLDVYPMSTIVKVGDTLADIDEAHSAGMWSVAVVRHGNEVGLSQEALEQMPPEEVRERLSTARIRLSSRGPHYLIDSTADLIPVIEEISERVADGEKP